MKDFKWKLKNKVFTLDQMDVEFRLVALAHCYKMIERSTRDREKEFAKLSQLEKKMKADRESINEIIRLFNERQKYQLKDRESIKEEISKLDGQNSFFEDKLNVLHESLVQEGFNPPETLKALKKYKRDFSLSQKIEEKDFVL